MLESFFRHEVKNLYIYQNWVKGFPLSLVGTPVSTYRPSQNKCYLDFFGFMPCCQERLDISRAKHQLHDACTSGGPCTDLAYSSWPNFWDKFRSGKVRFQSTAILQHHILRDIASTFTMLHCYSYIYCMGMFLDMAILTEFSIILGSAEKKQKKDKWNEFEKQKTSHWGPFHCTWQHMFPHQLL